jgi:hypothetical protein
MGAPCKTEARKINELSAASTVVKWHRRGFRIYWRWRSRCPGRPKTSAEIQALIRQFSRANPLWGPPRVRGELLGMDGGRLPRELGQGMHRGGHTGRPYITRHRRVGRDAPGRGRARGSRNRDHHRALAQGLRPSLTRISAGPQSSPRPRSPSRNAPPRRREPMADKSWKTIKPFQMSPGISSCGRTRTRTLDPLIKSQVVDEAIQGLSCKRSQNGGIQSQWLAGRL